MEDFNIENYDRAIEKLIRNDYPIPEYFNKRVEMTIKSLRTPQRVLKYSITAASALIFFFLAVNLVPSVAIQASYIPGLNIVIDWLVINKGEKNALENGYPAMGPVTVQKNGYAIQLEDIFIDDVSIRLSAKLTSDELMENRSPEQTETQLMTDDNGNPIPMPAKEQPAVISFHLESNELNLVQTSSSCSQPGKSEVVAQEIHMFFNDYSTLSDFLESEPEYLSFSAQIYKNDYVDCVIENIRIPIEKERILLSRHYDLSGTIDLDHTAVSLKALKVSPTRMVVETHYLPKNDYYMQRFEKIWLKDSEGNIYDISGQTGMGKSGAPDLGVTMYHHFVPSVYFERKMPERLFFCYEGYRIGAFKGTAFELDINDTYPKTVKFLHEDVIIEGFKYHDNNMLELTMKFPEIDVMSQNDVISPDIIFVDSTLRSVDMHVNNIREENSKKYTLFIKDIPEKDSYKIDLWGAGYHIDASGEIELDNFRD